MKKGTTCTTRTVAVFIFASYRVLSAQDSFDLRSITEINYHPPVSIQKFLFSNQSLTKDVQWNRTSRAIAVQEGVSIAKGGQESNSADNFSIYLR